MPWRVYLCGKLNSYSEILGEIQDPAAAYVQKAMEL